MRASVRPTSHRGGLVAGFVCRRLAAMASSGEESQQIDLLHEALDDLLRLIPPQDLETRVTDLRLVTGRWWLDANIRWRGATPEDTSSVSLEIGLALRKPSAALHEGRQRRGVRGQEGEDG